MRSSWWSWLSTLRPEQAGWRVQPRPVRDRRRRRAARGLTRRGAGLLASREWDQPGTTRNSWLLAIAPDASRGVENRYYRPAQEGFRRRHNVPETYNEAPCARGSETCERWSS